METVFAQIIMNDMVEKKVEVAFLVNLLPGDRTH